MDSDQPATQADSTGAPARVTRSEDTLTVSVTISGEYLSLTMLTGERRALYQVLLTLDELQALDETLRDFLMEIGELF